MPATDDPWDRNEDAQGVHLMTGEYSLCGAAWDGEDGRSEQMRPTRKRTVTCPECVRIILQCKAARVDRNAAEIYYGD